LAEEFKDRVTVLLGRFDARNVAAAGEQDEPGSGNGAGDRPGLGRAADEVELVGHNEGGTFDVAEQPPKSHYLAEKAALDPMGARCDGVSEGRLLAAVSS
jgi:hypothetical protein